MSRIKTDLNSSINGDLMNLNDDLLINVPASIEFSDFNGFSEQAALWNAYVDAIDRIKQFEQGLVPEGYALVPVEPDDAMIDAGFIAMKSSIGPVLTYKAMIKAAQEESK